MNMPDSSTTPGDSGAAAVVTDPSLVTGIVRERTDGGVSLAIPGTDYVLHVASQSAPTLTPGAKVRGRLHAHARRIDIIRSGGCYIEPVEGRPRRIQGRVVSVDEINDALLVRAAAVVVCRTNPGQKAGMFKPGQLVSFDVEPGVRFELAG